MPRCCFQQECPASKRQTDGPRNLYHPFFCERQKIQRREKSNTYTNIEKKGRGGRKGKVRCNPSIDTNKQKTNRHVNPAKTHVHTNRHRHARRVHFPTLMHAQRHTQRHTPFWRRHDDFLPPVSSLSLTHTHTHSLSLSRFGWEMQRGKCPAQSTSAAVTDNWR